MPPPPSFDIALALDAALLAGAAYTRERRWGGDPRLTGRYEEDAAWRSQRPPRLGAPRAFMLFALGPGAPTALVVFRGSQEPFDFLLDALVAPMRFKTGWSGSDPPLVHTGFGQAYARRRQALMSAYKRLVGEGIGRIVFVGHSLGGALATLAACDLGQEVARCGLGLAAGALRVELISFGASRVGDARFAAACASGVAASWRVVNEEDPIPRLATGLAAYRHVRWPVVLSPAGCRVAPPAGSFPSGEIPLLQNATGLDKWWERLPHHELDQDDPAAPGYVQRLQASA